MIYYFLLFLFSFPLVMHADIFKADSKNHDLQSLNAPYNFQKTEVDPLISLRINTDLEISKSIDILDGKNIVKAPDTSPLVILSYSDPVHADVFKHYQTISYLRLAFNYQRLKDLEENGNQMLNKLRKKAFLECIEDKKFRTKEPYINDLSGLINSCAEGEPFKSLHYANDKNIYENIFGTFHMPKETKNLVLTILPRLYINKNKIFLDGPQQRIGNVLSKFKDENLKVINKVLDSYKDQKKFVDEDIEALSLPNKSFQKIDVLYLLSLNENEKESHIDSIASRLAVSQSLDQYNTGIEWMSRYVIHPNLSDVYKDHLNRGIKYLEGEKSSLVEKLQDIKDYSLVIDEMTKAARVAQDEALKNLKDQEQYKVLQGL